MRARQDAVEWFYQTRKPVREKLRALLDDVLDHRTLAGPHSPPSRGSGRSRRPAGQPAKSCRNFARCSKNRKRPGAFIAPLKACEDIVEFVGRAITDRPPSDFERGNIIRHGFSPELDELRDVLGGGREFLAEIEDRERERTGIRSLKVGYNKVFGYYIEVTKPNLKLVPSDYIRKQTLTNAERYFTLELKEHESLIANARERILELETNLYRQVCDEIGRHHDAHHQVAADCRAHRFVRRAGRMRRAVQLRPPGTQ